eukprot:TRINITY_DN11632_c0_g1_i3.p2 TRINITY_DN11632_c0_g1~~TRINITY_DN11632_c0_g1_i3.p2  ORF type:complete len:135 (-),score=24.80 TRINITY_DN11632_c0_g1_i3:105-509(-)
MIRRPPRSTHCISSAASDVYKRQVLNASLKEQSVDVAEVIVVGAKPSAFGTTKTGASTNISTEQMAILPSISRSLDDFTRLSPYSGAGNSFGGRDGRLNNVTIDGANFNNNFGLSNGLPGGCLLYTSPSPRDQA